MASAKEKTTVVPIRLPVSRLKMLEAIKSERGHRWRNDTLNDAIDQYVERYLRARKDDAA